MTDVPTDIIQIIDAPPEVFAVQEQGVGPAGSDAKVAMSFTLSGPYSAREWMFAAVMDGAGTFTPADSSATARVVMSGITTRYVTKNGVFVNPSFATALEIANALFATITFPAGPGFAVWTYPNGGDFVHNDIIELWESGTPDPTGANTAYTFAGA